MSTRLSKLSRLVKATTTKLQMDDQEEYGLLFHEYQKLEQVGPSPGNPWDQHDTMVRKGLCQAAVKHKEENRYCNLFPYDANRVVLEGDKDYINASWVALPGVEDKLILTMGPLHPESYNKYKRTDCQHLPSGVDHGGPAGGQHGGHALCCAGGLHWVQPVLPTNGGG